MPGHKMHYYLIGFLFVVNSCWFACLAGRQGFLVMVLGKPNNNRPFTKPIAMNLKPLTLIFFNYFNP